MEDATTFSPKAIRIYLVLVHVNTTNKGTLSLTFAITLIQLITPKQYHPRFENKNTITILLSKVF